MSNTAKATIAGLLGYGIFGFSFLFSKIALNQVSPFVLLAVRFVTAFIVLNLLLFTGRVHLSFRGKPVAALLLLGLVQPVMYFIFESYGISLTSAAFSGVMIGMVPIFGLLFSVLFLKERCTIFQGICTVLSIGGVALTTTGGFGGSSFTGFLLLLGAVISGALFTILSRKTSEHFSAFERTYIMFALGSIVFVAVAYVQCRGDYSAIASGLSSPSFWAAILYLAVISSVCAFLLINYALSHIPASRAMIYSNFTPVISFFAGILLMGDRFTPVQVLGVVLIVASVFGVSYQKPVTKTDKDISD